MCRRKNTNKEKEVVLGAIERSDPGKKFVLPT